MALCECQRRKQRMCKSLKIIGLVVLLVYIFLVTIGKLHPPWPTMPGYRMSRVPRVLGCADACGPGSTEQPVQKVNFSNFNATTDPGYFKWIDDDLSPWKETGISRHMLQESKKKAAFRAIIHKGKLYIERYHECYQTRMMFTIWGLLELLEKYPGQVPDVEFYFNCEDRPLIEKKRFRGRVPPPLFGYDSTHKHFDIPFPDWTFWGWPEIHIAPWEEMLNTTKQQLDWDLKDPHAQWKGNILPDRRVTIRKELLKCNNTQTGAYIYGQDWVAEERNKFAKSKLEEQCNYRYKIYIEGYTWSVSRKYIMSCGSVVLSIDSDFYDFFTRGLVSGKHYLPIRSANSEMCGDIQRSIEWGNSHPSEAKAVAAASRDFVEQELSMDNVYRYILKMLKEYAKLQKFKVDAPELDQRACKDSVRCIAPPLHRAMLD